MHDGVAAGHNAFQQRRIADIADDKFDLRLRQPVDVRRIARIRQLVQYGDVRVRMIARHVPHEIRADEPASARHQNIARLNPAAVPRQTTHRSSIPFAFSRHLI